MIENRIVRGVRGIFFAKPDITWEEFIKQFYANLNWQLSLYPAKEVSFREKAFAWIKKNYLDGHCHGKKCYGINTRLKFLYYKIICAVNKLMADKLLRDGMITFPNSMGSIVMYSSAEETIRHSRHSTIWLWLHDEEAFKQRIKIYGDKPTYLVWPVYEWGRAKASKKLFFRPFVKFMGRYLAKNNDDTLPTYLVDEEKEKLFFRRFYY